MPPSAGDGPGSDQHAMEHAPLSLMSNDVAALDDVDMLPDVSMDTLNEDDMKFLEDLLVMCESADAQLPGLDEANAVNIEPSSDGMDLQKTMERCEAAAQAPVAAPCRSAAPVKTESRCCGSATETTCSKRAVAPKQSTEKAPAKATSCCSSKSSPTQMKTSCCSKDQPSGKKKGAEPDDQATKEMLRRQRHRETMRRSRQRFRDQIMSMHEMVSELEGLKNRLLSENTADASAETKRRVRAMKLLAMVQRQTGDLRTENLTMRERLTRALMQISHTHPAVFEDADHNVIIQQHTTLNQSRQGEQLTLCDFVGWDAQTVSRCLELVRSSFDEIKSFHAACERGGEEGTVFKWSENVHIMGWTGQRRLVSGTTSLQFSFEKTFPTHSAMDLLQKTWKFCQHKDSFIQMFTPVAARMELEILGQINDDVFVMRRMQEETEGGSSNVRKYRSIYLLYRLQAPEGLFIVFRSINPTFTQACTCAGNSWVELFHWFWFAPAGNGCVVRYGGTLDAQTREFAQRWVREVFFSLLRWEAVNVAPFLLLG